MLTRNLQLFVLGLVSAALFGCADDSDHDDSQAEATVGKVCEPKSVPEGGLDPQEAYVEAQNAACGAGVCLAYRVPGDPRAACRAQPGACSASDPACSGSARCTDAADIEKHVSCSCRCDGPDTQAHYCACPDGFLCVPVLEQGDPSLVGSYCTRP